jgi:hypothetical protein
MDGLQEFSDSAAKLRSLLAKPLEFCVNGKAVNLRRLPTLDKGSDLGSSEEVLAKLEPGAVVQGVPADATWLHVEKSEADDWLLPDSPAAAPSTGAWVHMNGSDEGYLCPHWSVVTATALKNGVEMRWPGIPETGASYTIQWRGKDPSDKQQQGQRIVGKQPCALIPTIDDPSKIEVLVTARLPAGFRLLGTWAEPQLLDRRYSDAAQRRSRKRCEGASEDNMASNPLHAQDDAQECTQEDTQQMSFTLSVSRVSTERSAGKTSKKSTAVARTSQETQKGYPDHVSRGCACRLFERRSE